MWKRGFIFPGDVLTRFIDAVTVNRLVSRVDLINISLFLKLSSCRSTVSKVH